jgi:hypothetical protein
MNIIVIVDVENTSITEGALYDWLGGGNSRHTKEIRKKAVGAMAASRSVPT